ncbi:hypothetical protein [Glycomyces sp. NPDC048151]|uniref:hypothetical protein n=1 Tax=Glycomyces sp. NPDC048151 TaxID=3364002 RepID=UPI0037177B0D
MSYSGIYLDAKDPQRVVEVVEREFGLAAGQVHLVLGEGSPPSGPGWPAVVVTCDPVERTVEIEVEFEEPFPAPGGDLSALEFAKVLCGGVGCRAYVSSAGLTPNQWILVTPEGGHGVVLTDDDAGEGGLQPVFAYALIEGAPEIPVWSETG